MIKTVIFDMDGVIFDSETMYINDLIRFFKQHDIEIQVSDCIPLDEAPLGLKTHKNQVLTAFAAFC